uniref:Serine incorporator 3 n=1 Tax=Zonotrichia albicollis TaxID=44394 RepID=A0A8D2QBK1_ZONAL
MGAPGSNARVSCLCGSAPCLLCGCCPSAKNSTISRLLFTFFLFLGTLVSIIMIIPGVEKELHKLPGFCEGSGSVLGVQTKVDCSSFLGHKAVYRMGFAMAAFFCLFAVLMVCVRSSKDPRAALQNGYTFFHLCLLLAALYIMMTLTNWAVPVPAGPLLAALCTVTFIFYAASITAIVLLYVYYTKPEGCTEGKAFISINLILCLIVSVVSILPKIQEHPQHPLLCLQEAQPHSGLLQASLITLYTIYITWAALANVPSKPDAPGLWGGLRCNPTLLLRNSTGSATATEPLTTWWDAPSIVGLVIFILCTLFIREWLDSSVGVTLRGGFSVGATSRVDSSVGVTLRGGSSHGAPPCSLGAPVPLWHRQGVTAMVPPSRGCSRPDESLQVLSSPWTAVWVKISSSWAGLLLYLWTLVAPLLLPDRDFS